MQLFVADSWSLRRWEARIALLLLPLKSRSGVDHLQFLRRLTAFALAWRETAGDGGSEGLWGAARAGGLQLLLLKLRDFGGELLPRNFTLTHTNLPISGAILGSSRQP